MTRGCTVYTGLCLREVSASQHGPNTQDYPEKSAGPHSVLEEAALWCAERMLVTTEEHNGMDILTSKQGASRPSALLVSSALFISGPPPEGATHFGKGSSSLMIPPGNGLIDPPRGTSLSWFQILLS